jgi:hypothetical protein
MLKSRRLGLLGVAVLLALTFTGCKGLTLRIPISNEEQITVVFDGQGDFEMWVPTDEGQITLDNGNVYTYWPDDDIDSDYTVNGVNLYQASKEELAEALTDEIPAYTASGEITTSEQAAFCGATVLELAYEEWTQTSLIHLDYNEDTDVWLVHGLLEDRTSPVIPLGVVALDGSTGEVIAIGLDTHTDCD